MGEKGRIRMYQITPEDYFSQQVALRRIEPKKEEVKNTPQLQPIIIGQPNPQNQNTSDDKFFFLSVLAIIALFCIALVILSGDSKK